MEPEKTPPPLLPRRPQSDGSSPQMSGIPSPPRPDPLERIADALESLQYQTGGAQTPPLEQIASSLGRIANELKMVNMHLGSLGSLVYLEPISDALKQSNEIAALSAPSRPNEEWNPFDRGQD